MAVRSRHGDEIDPLWKSTGSALGKIRYTPVPYTPVRHSRPTSLGPRLYCVYSTRRTATRWCAVTQHGRVWVAAIEGELHDTIHKVDASYSKHVRDTFPQFPSRLAPRRRKRYRVQSTVHTETAERSCGRHTRVHGPSPCHARTPWRSRARVLNAAPRAKPSRRSL
jgi:hypothetical protein